MFGNYFHQYSGFLELIQAFIFLKFDYFCKLVIDLPKSDPLKVEKVDCQNKEHQEIVKSELQKTGEKDIPNN